MTLACLDISSKKRCLLRLFTYHFKAHTISNKLVSKVFAQKKGEKSYDSSNMCSNFCGFTSQFAPLPLLAPFSVCSHGAYSDIQHHLKAHRLLAIQHHLKAHRLLAPFSVCSHGAYSDIQHHLKAHRISNNMVSISSAEGRRRKVV